MIFDVIITETRSKVVQVDALSEDEALDRVEGEYLKGEIALNADDIEDTSYLIAEK